MWLYSNTTGLCIRRQEAVPGETSVSGLSSVNRRFLSGGRCWTRYARAANTDHLAPNQSAMYRRQTRRKSNQALSSSQAPQVRGQHRPRTPSSDLLTIFLGVVLVLSFGISKTRQEIEWQTHAMLRSTARLLVSHACCCRSVLPRARGTTLQCHGKACEPSETRCRFASQCQLQYLALSR